MFGGGSSHIDGMNSEFSLCETVIKYEELISNRHLGCLYIYA